jgi:hypothetical protein
MTESAVEGGKVICIRVDDEKSVEGLFEPTALILDLQRKRRTEAAEF